MKSKEKKEYLKLWKGRIRKRKWILYLCVFLFPLIYVYFFSDSNIKKHRSLDVKAQKLQSEIERLNSFVSNSYSYEEISASDSLLEKYAREQLNMKKPNEDLFVIEHP